MEWDGSSLQDATFEEARDIMSRAGDTVQVVLMHCRYDMRCIYYGVPKSQLLIYHTLAKITRIMNVCVHLFFSVVSVVFFSVRSYSR